MENSNTMKTEETFDLIQRMINTAKEDLEDQSFYYLLWGWLVFISSIIHFVMIKMNSPLEGIGWVILMPLGGVVSMIYGYRQDKKQKVKTYVDELMKYVLIAFAVALLTVLLFQTKLGLSTYPMVMLVYGIWLFISGGALKFKPIIIGGIVNWALAIVAFFTNFEQQLLLLAAAVLIGYIIPGYLLKNKYRNVNR